MRSPGPQPGIVPDDATVAAECSMTADLARVGDFLKMPDGNFVRIACIRRNARNARRWRDEVFFDLDPAGFHVVRGSSCIVVLRIFEGKP